MSKAISFPVASVSRPCGVLHLCSTSCLAGEHHTCSGAAELPGMTIHCTCDCHNGKPATQRLQTEYLAA